MPNSKNLVTIFACFAVLATIAYLRSDSSASSTLRSNTRLLQTLQEKVCSDIRTTEYKSWEKSHFDKLDATLNIYTKGRDELESAIINEDFDEYYKWLAIVAIPWIVLAVLVACFYKLLFLWWCCPNIIPCRKFRREVRTLTTAQDKKFSCCVAFLSILILVCLIITLILTPMAYNGAKKTVCSSFVFTDRILDGDSDTNNNFQGFRSLLQPVDNVIALAPQANTAMNNALADNTTHNTDWAKEYLPKIDSIENEIFGFRDNYYIPSPNPKLGPISDSNTLSGGINNVVNNNLQGPLGALQIVKENVEFLTYNFSGVLANLTRSRGFIQETITNIDNLKEKPEGYDIERLAYTFKVLIVVFVCLSFAGPAVAFLNELVYFLTNKRKNAFWLHFSWIWLGLFVSLGFLFLVFLFPLSIAIYNSCQLSHKFTENEATFNGFPNRFAATVSTRITPCFFGNGDILEGILLRENVERYKAISENVDIFTQSYNLGQDAKFATVSAHIQAQSDIISPYIAGFNADIDNPSTGNDNANISVYDLTLHSDYSKVGSKQVSVGNCLVSRDEWVYDLTQCKYAFTWDNSYGNTQYLNDQSCIAISQMTSAQVNDRYQSLDTNCQSQLDDKIQAHFDTLKAYDEGRRSNFSHLLNKTVTAKSLTDEARTKSLNILPHVTAIKADAVDLYTNVTDSVNGINTRFNCTGLQESFKEVPNDICLGTFLKLFHAIVFLLIALILGVFATWYAYAKALDDCEKKDNLANYEMAHSTIV